MGRLFGVGLLLLSCYAAGARADFPLIDAHSQVADGIGIETVLSRMKEAGVSRTLLSGRGSSSRDVVEAARAHPDRITASINMKIPPQILRDGAAEQLQRITRAGAAPAFGALSEVMICHAQKGSRAPEILRDFNSPEFEAALAIVLERHWPLVVHIEFAYARSIGRFDEYMTALEAQMSAHPEVPIALSHMGQLGAADVRRLIEAHPNIYFVTS